MIDAKVRAITLLHLAEVPGRQARYTWARESREANWLRYQNNTVTHAPDCIKHSGIAGHHAYESPAFELGHGKQPLPYPEAAPLATLLAHSSIWRALLPDHAGCGG